MMLWKYKDDCMDEKPGVAEKRRIQTRLGVTIFFGFCLREAVNGD